MQNVILEALKAGQSVESVILQYAETWQRHAIIRGEVDVHKDEYMSFLDEVYGEVEVCGYSYGAGAVLEAIDPVAFNYGKSDYEDSLTTDMQEAIENEDFSDFEFSDGMDADMMEAAIAELREGQDN
jgi:hypothetical protein